jgi:hypothetical protein
MLRKRAAVTAVAALALLAPARGFAQPADTYDLLPDRYYVKTECATLQQAASAYPALAAEGLTVRTICDQYAASGDGQAWLTAIEPHATKIRSYDPNSGLYAGTTLSSDQRIPNTYNVYALFLVTSDTYVNDLPSYNALYGAFKSFGDGIGSDRLAVWFRNRPPDAGFDVGRAKDYADQFQLQKLNLGYNDGPFLIITSSYPDRPQSLDKVTILRFAGLAPDNVVALLNVAEQEMRTQAQIDKRALVYEEVKQRLFATLKSHPDFLKNVALFAISGSGADKVVESALGTPAK